MRFLILFLCLMIFSCSHETGPAGESPAALLRDLSETETYSGAAGCFTEGTVSSAEKLMSDRNFTEQNLFCILNFLHGAESWDLMPAEADDSSYTGDIIITGHIRDNMLGWRICCRMVREKGRWRIDMQKELDAVFSESGSGNKTYYRK